MNDPVNPQHYRNANNVQLIELIRFLPFSIGNSMKYVYRNERKENPQQDLEKALWYLEDYYKHPTHSSSAVVVIHPTLIDAVLEGAGAWESEAVRKIHAVFKSAEGGENFEDSYAAAKEHISRRLGEVKKRETALCDSPITE